MSDLPKNIGLLGAIVTFCGAVLVALLQGSAPLAAAKKAALCAVAAALVAWFCARIGVGVLREGLMHFGQEDEA